MPISSLSWPPLTATPSPRVLVGDVIDFSDVLTREDKGLVEAVTGYDVDAPYDPAGDPGVPGLVAAIAVSRSLGFLTGPLTPVLLRRHLSPADIGSGVMSSAVEYLQTSAATEPSLAGAIRGRPWKRCEGGERRDRRGD